MGLTAFRSFPVEEATQLWFEVKNPGPFSYASYSSWLSPTSLCLFWCPGTLSGFMKILIMHLMSKILLLVPTLCKRVPLFHGPGFFTFGHSWLLAGLAICDSILFLSHPRSLSLVFVRLRPRVGLGGMGQQVAFWGWPLHVSPPL